MAAPTLKVPGAGLKVARDLARQGICVFPVRLTRVEGEKWEKKPLTAHGHNDASANTDQIEKWAAQFPDCRWGAVATEFVAIDLDSEAGRTKAESLGIPLTAPRLATAREGGQHVYCKSFPGAGCWAGRLSGVDSRGGGTGWVVVYGRFDLSQLPEAPDWFKDVSRYGEERPFPVGTHDRTLARICGRLWKLQGVTEAEVLEKLTRIGAAQAEGDYTYQEKDLLRIVRSIGRKESRSTNPSPRIPRPADDSRAPGVVPPSPWDGRPGWTEEKEIPIRTYRVENKDGSTAEVPYEPAYVLYNELAADQHMRAFRTRNQQLRVAIPTSFGLKVLDPVADSRGRSGLSQYVTYHCFIESGKKIPRADIAKVSEAFAGRAASDELPPERVVDLSLRIAPRPGVGCILDMRDQRQRCIVVGPEGWRIEATGHPIFDPRPHMQALPTPVHPSSIAAGVGRLFQFVLLPPPERAGPREGENQRLLFLASIVTRLLYPSSQKPAHVFSGTQKVGKTSTAKIDQAILDPSVTPVLKPPSENEIDDYLRVLALNRATINFDNLSGISKAFSDDLCRLITGSGIVNRKKYSDSDEIFVNALPQVILNGITATPEAADLLRRCLLFRLVSPAELDLRPMDRDQLERSWSEAHPEVLGTILDLAVLVAQELQRPQEPPFRDSDHMQAFHQVGQALAKVLGRAPLEFVKAFDLNSKDQGFAAAQTGHAQALIDFWNSNPGPEGKSSNDICDWIRRSIHAESFAHLSPHMVGRLMDRTIPTLEAAGIFIKPDWGHASKRLWVRVLRPPSPPLFAKTTPPIPPLESFGVFPTVEKDNGGVMEGLGGVGGVGGPAMEGLKSATPPSEGSTPPVDFTPKNEPQGGIGGVGGVETGKNAKEVQTTPIPSNGHGTVALDPDPSLDRFVSFLNRECRGRRRGIPQEEARAALYQIFDKAEAKRVMQAFQSRFRPDTVRERDGVTWWYLDKMVDTKPRSP